MTMVSYTDWRYERACGRKRTYETIHQASSAVVRKNIRDREAGRAQKWSWYECEFCAQFHLTTKPPKTAV